MYICYFYRKKCKNIEKQTNKQRIRIKIREQKIIIIIFVLWKMNWWDDDAFLFFSFIIIIIIIIGHALIWMPSFFCFFFIILSEHFLVPNHEVVCVLFMSLCPQWTMSISILINFCISFDCPLVVFFDSFGFAFNYPYPLIFVLPNKVPMSVDKYYVQFY